MPADCPAFKIGERIRFGAASQFWELQEFLREQQEKIDSGELPFGICEIFAADLTAHSGEEAEIKAISFYHFGTPIYEFHNVSGRWPEEALCDPQIDEASEIPALQPASLHYSVHFELHGDHEGMIQILGVVDGKTYWSARRMNAEWIANSIRQIAAIRCRCAFENLFMFDGHYGPYGEQ